MDHIKNLPPLSSCCHSITCNFVPKYFSWSLCLFLPNMCQYIMSAHCIFIKNNSIISSLFLPFLYFFLSQALRVTEKINLNLKTIWKQMQNKHRRHQRRYPLKCVQWSQTEKHFKLKEEKTSLL